MFNFDPGTPKSGKSLIAFFCDSCMGVCAWQRVENTTDITRSQIFMRELLAVAPDAVTLAPLGTSPGAAPNTPEVPPALR